MEVVNNMLRTILISIVITTITGISNTTSAPSSDNVKEGKNIQPIHRDINFDKSVKLTAILGGEAVLEDTYPKRFVLDYKEYADTFEEFRKKYPTFTLDTHGVAISESTFGDVAKYKFGQLTYPTSYFIADEDGYYNEIVDEFDAKFLAFEVSVEIKIGFSSKGSVLFLHPYMTGQLESHGFSERALRIGLHIYTITFNPANIK
ncbi:hypothetical protein PV325_003262 [Microctonus aethiopoides]|nr:hypothetical protein PV325_003262 [Microctonus aethiopoides]